MGILLKKAQEFHLTGIINATNSEWEVIGHEDREATFLNSLRSEEPRPGKPDYVEMVQTDDGGLHMVPVGDLVTI